MHGVIFIFLLEYRVMTITSASDQRRLFDIGNRFKKTRKNRFKPLNMADISHRRFSVRQRCARNFLSAIFFCVETAAPLLCGR